MKNLVTDESMPHNSRFHLRVGLLVYFNVVQCSVFQVVPPVFHGVWTDMRDVVPPADGRWDMYVPPVSKGFAGPACNPADNTAGMRNANIYTSRVTQGMFAGTPGNAKPLGFVVRDGVRQHLQRAFVVFVQNSLRETRYYRLKIMNQPGPLNTDRASFKQFPSPPYRAADPSDTPHDPRIAPITELFVSVPPISTVSRTLFVTAADPNAQVRIDVEETEAPPSGTTTPPPPLKANGMRSSILLNPDPTAPPLEGADVVVSVPDIAELEVHDHRAGAARRVTSRSSSWVPVPAAGVAPPVVSKTSSGRKIGGRPPVTPRSRGSIASVGAA